MILKKNLEESKPKKKVNSLIGIPLLLLSIILAVITMPFGFIFGIFYTILDSSKKVGEYCLQIAIIVDQMGNVIMQHLLNVLWIKPNGYKFGNRKETISSVLGKNQRDKTLTIFGNQMATILNRIDQNHTMNSIDYEVKYDGN